MTLKYSRQREAIKDFLATRKDHPSADTIYLHLRRDFPNISLGTIYRNLTLLANLGEISRISVGESMDHFDFDTSVHYHFICGDCSDVIDLEIENPLLLDNIKPPNFDGTITGHCTYFFGQCAICKANENKDRTQKLI